MSLRAEMYGMRAERCADSYLLTRHKAGAVKLTPDQLKAISRRARAREARYDLIVAVLDHAEGDEFDR